MKPLADGLSRILGEGAIAVKSTAAISVLVFIA